MPVSIQIDCPACGIRLRRRPGGCCPACGAAVGARVQEARRHEERMERIVAVVGTALVLAVSLLTAGVGLLEGIAVYAGAGGLMFFLARKTFG